MSLTASFLHRVLDLEPMLERRAEPRHACQLTGTCRIIGTADDTVRAVAVQEVAAHAIRFSTDRLLAQGTLLAVELQGPTNSIGPMLVRACRVEADGPNGWTVSGTLAQSLTNQEWESLFP